MDNLSGRTGKDSSVQVTATQRGSAFKSSENLGSKLLFDTWFRLLKLGKSEIKVLNLGKSELKVLKLGTYGLKIAF